MFSTVDWLIVLSYLVFAFLIGLLMTRTASRGLSSYFVAERSLPWWWLGTSMVATSFAADTPLAITGIVANDGVSGNWFWWSWIFTFVVITVFFARKWRQSGVLTDVELIELRYSGGSAGILRMFKAFYMGIIVNCVIMGWVFRAMSKITSPFVDWRELLGRGAYAHLDALWPDFLIFDDFNNTLSVLAVFVIVVVYSSMGGIRGVIITDLFQFALAMFTAILFAVYAVQHVGGLQELWQQLANLYPGKYEDMVDIWPHFDNVLLPFEVFLIFIAVQWWAQYYSDGSGYLAQRMNTARTPADAEKGALWFTMANFCLRTWPWIMVGLVAVAVFPLDDPDRFHALGAEVADDREMGYPILMKLVLPSGLLGLTFASLMAAFMSTVDTHINWGASYMVNDVYKRFIRPDASERELVLVSRISVVSLALIAVVVASQIESIESAWKFFVSLGAGLGLPQILRWIWWRANAWTEISGMVAAFCSSVMLYTVFPDVRSEYLLFWTVLLSTTTAFVVTFLTSPVPEATLQSFIERVSPMGFWQERTRGYRAHNHFRRRLVMLVLGLATAFSGVFCLGYLLLLRWQAGLLLLLVCAATFFWLTRMMARTE